MTEDKLLRLEKLLKDNIKHWENRMDILHSHHEFTKAKDRKYNALYNYERIRRDQLRVVQDLLWGPPVPAPKSLPRGWGL